MAQFGTHHTFYSNIRLGATVATRSFVQGVYSLPEYDGRAKALGTASVRLKTMSSLTSLVDGTMAVNASAETYVALTYTSGKHVASLRPEELEQYDAQAQAADYQAAVNAQILAVETALATAYMAATPGGTAALPTGQANFTNDGTDAEMRQNLNILDTGWAHVMSRTGGNPTDLFIVTNYLGYANLLTMADVQGSPVRFGADTGLIYRGGTPIYVSRNTATGWKYPGVTNLAGGTAAIIAHRDSAAAAFAEPYLHGGGVLHATDGFEKYIWLCPYATGVAQNLWYEITNTSS